MHLSDGRSFEVRHPELCMVGKRTAVVGLTADPAQIVYERTVSVDLLQIVTLEPVAPTTSNGST